MKKNKTILIIALLLAIVAAILIFMNQSATIREDLRDFAVSDTASVTKIFLADKYGASVLLERKDAGSWIVNKKYNAQPGVLSILLQTMHDVSVQMRVAKAGYNGVIMQLAATGIKCEIYQHGEDTPSKVYYVGESTQDVLGTYMMLENSAAPFVTEIRGFDGYLTSRYSTDENSWRETMVFDYTPEQLKKIEIDYTNQPDKSFVLERTGNFFSVYSPATKSKIQNVDVLGLNTYLTYFKNLHFEQWNRDLNEHEEDSLRKSFPAFTVSITDVKGEKKILPVYPKTISENSLAKVDSLGNPLKFDLDRMFAIVNNGKDLVTIQQHVFKKILVRLNDFDLSLKNTKTN